MLKKTVLAIELLVSVVCILITPVLFKPDNKAFAQSALSISNISDNRTDYSGSTIPKYSKLEISFNIDGSVAKNFEMPYDASPPSGLQAGQGISVDAQFTPDNWQTVYTIPAFYYQDFDYQVKSGRDWFYPKDEYFWEVRFSPTQEGNWQYRLIAQDASGSVESSPQSFSVVNSSNHGFIEVSKLDSRYFTFSDGTYFPGLGYNLNYRKIDWVNPVQGNNEQFIKMGENGIQLIRLWLSQWTIYGSSWNPWKAIQMGGYIPWLGTTFAESYPGSEVSMEIDADPSANRCMFIGSWEESAPPVNPGKRYVIKVRYKTANIDPSYRIDSTMPYGFVVKTGGWLWDSSESARCYYPGSGTVLSSYQPENVDWQILETAITTGSVNFLPNLYLVMENLTHGSAFIDYVWIQEDLGNGQLGPNIVKKPWMAHHLYFDQSKSYGFDKVVELAEANGVYLRPVLMEKNEWIFNRIDWNGNVVSTGDNANFYGNWRTVNKVRWLQQTWWRYVQARWGYSTNIHSWELLNEGDPYSGLHWTLTDEFGKYMHQFKPNSHLVSTSNWHSFPKTQFWANKVDYPNIDFSDVHLYNIGNQDTTLRVDDTYYSVNSIADYSDTIKTTLNLSQLIGAKTSLGPGVPVVRGECGFIATSGNDVPDPALLNDTEGIWLHKSIWALINPGGVYDACNWWPDTHIYSRISDGTYNFDHRNEYGNYYKFIKDIPLNNGFYVDAAATVDNPQLIVLGQKDLTNYRAHLWIANRNHTWNNVVDNVSITPINSTVTLTGFAPSTTYPLETWNTYTGAIFSTSTVTADSSGAISLDVTDLTDDYAVKIGDYSNAPTPTPTPLPPMIAPTVNCSTSSATVSWVSQSGASDYWVQVWDALNPSHWFYNFWTGSTGTTIYIANVDPGDTLTAQVAWTNDPTYVNVSTFSPTSSAQCPSPTPTPTATPTPAVTNTPTPTLTPTSGTNAWPMVAANPQRTSWTPEEVTGTSIIWYRQIEPYIPPYSQIIAANDTLFISTTKGLVALDPSSGALKWTFATDMPLGNSPTISNGVAYVGGFDHKLYAINIANGVKLWSYDGAGAGYDTNPLVVNNMVYLGNRDGYFYAIYANEQAQKGTLAWRYKTDGPIPFSAAASTNNGTIYFASNDGHAYALNATSGSLVWKSSMIPSFGFRNWWPVVYLDKVLFVGTSPYRLTAPAGADMADMDRTDLLSTIITRPGEIGSRNGMSLNVDQILRYYENPSATQSQTDPSGANRNTQKPWRRTSFILNQADGSEYTFDTDGNGQMEYYPRSWYGTRAGSVFPPIVGSDNTLYQAMAFYNNTYNMPRGAVVGWTLGSNTITTPSCGNGTSCVDAGGTYAFDEPLAYSSGGNYIYNNLCCDRAASWFTLDGSSKGNYWLYSLDSRAPGYASMYWGTAESGLNKIFGTSNGVYGEHGDNNPLVPYQQKLYVVRSNAVIAIGSGTSLGLITPRITITAPSTSVSISVDQLKNTLDSEINKMISAGHLKPAYNSVGNFDGVAGHGIYLERFLDNWHNTAELMSTLGRAYPYVSVSTQTRIKTYLQSEFTNYSPITYSHNGWNTGTAREPYELPPEVASNMSNSGPNQYGYADNYFRDYGLWKYAQLFPSEASSIFNQLRGRPNSSTSFTQYYQLNAAIAGMKGYLELAKMVNNTSEIAWAQSALDQQMAARAANFTKDTGNPNDVANDYTHTLAVATNFMYMTPELGDYLNQNALTTVNSALEEYTWIEPYWFVSRFGATYAEGAMQPLFDYEAIFQAKAYIQKQSREELVKYLDVPAAQIGDLFYLNNLVAAIEAPSNGSPTPTPTTIPTPTPTWIPGDTNGDGVDGVDYVVWLNHYNPSVIQPGGPAIGNFNYPGDDYVDGIDYVIWLNNYP